MNLKNDELTKSINTIGDVFVKDARIKARNVNVFYAEKKAIDEVTIDIGNKEVISFIGPSGCGKSTFLRCFNRMNDTIDICRFEGSITLDEEHIYDKNVEVLSLSIDGYYLKTNNEILYIPFDYPCENSKQIRNEFINYAKKFKI